MSMQSRRDLFQAHRLMTQRAALALLRGEPDVPDQPLRRLNVGTFSGVLVAVIVVGVFGIWGLIFHGTPALTDQPGTLVQNKQTGTNYVFCEKGKDLCPVINYTSARLILQTPNPTLKSVNQSQLAAFGQGPLIGIPDLPADIPAQSQLLTQPWSVCAQTSIVNGSGAVTTTTLAVGRSVNGQPLGSDALAVRSQQGSQSQDWLIWQNQRMSIQPDTLSDVFKLTAAELPSVPLVWLNAVPQTTAFAAPSVAGQFPGQEEGGTVAGPDGEANVGQLYSVEVASGTQYYVLTGSGTGSGLLAPITKVQETLLSFEPGAPAAVSLLPEQVNGHTTSAISQPGLPATTPAVAAADLTGQDAPFCAVYTGPPGGPATGPTLSMQVETGGVIPQGGLATGSASGSATVEHVVLPPGGGALVRQIGNNISYFLVTDGHRYPMASVQVPLFLGYTPSLAVKVPPSLLAVIPAGPGLNPQQASDTVAGG